MTTKKATTNWGGARPGAGLKTTYLVAVKGEEPPTGYQVLTAGVDSLRWNEKRQCMTSVHEVMSNRSVLDADETVLWYRKGTAADYE
jgi:hypothetical protein